MEEGFGEERERVKGVVWRGGEVTLREVRVREKAKRKYLERERSTSIPTNKSTIQETFVVKAPGLILFQAFNYIRNSNSKIWNNTVVELNF